MRICYIAPVATVTQVTPTEMNWVQEQFYNALNQFWGEICVWANGMWIKFIDSSFIICLSIAFAGAICGVLGIKGGYKVTIFSIVFYCFVRLFSYLMGWY